uniref:Uncharacterized protein n=1 Tax=Anguilla anguilla TaxID=7936 RepID=A0A0E9XF10_ANGAN
MHFLYILYTHRPVLPEHAGIVQKFCIFILVFLIYCLVVEICLAIIIYGTGMFVGHAEP